MIKIENTEVHGWEAAIRGARNALESWSKMDSHWAETSCGNTSYDYEIGENDLSLMKKLIKGGDDEAKFMRMLTVQMDITTNQVVWSEFDTYKVGSVRNSCSKMHKIQAHEFTPSLFSCEGIINLGGRTKEVFEIVLEECEELRRLYNDTKDPMYWRALIELLPEGFNLRATVQLNYQILRHIYKRRKNHKMFEWHDFCRWIESLPYSELITDE